MDKRVTGIGGFFFKSKDPNTLKEWYKNHLGLHTDAYGCTFRWKDSNGKDASTQWSPFAENTTYFKPKKKTFMMNGKKVTMKISTQGIRTLKKKGIL